MTLVAGFWIWQDSRTGEQVPGTLTLSSPISVQKVIWFAILFVSIQIVGTILTKHFGSYGMFATGIFGGLVSSASTTAAAATMAMHGKISASLAGSATVLTSLTSAAVNIPIVWRTAKDRTVNEEIASPDGYCDWNGSRCGHRRSGFPILRAAVKKMNVMNAGCAVLQGTNSPDRSRCRAIVFNGALKP
jgi:hypothetical protein